jgi:hypothetical protein
MKFYQIRRKSDGLYAGGGMNPRFSPSAKICTIGNLKKHIAFYKSYWNISTLEEFNQKNHCYNDCEIVELEVTKTNHINFSNFYKK